VRLKYLPRLAFREDPAIEAGQRVEAILRDLHDGEEAT
jgi:ribosome-binding factor A